MRRPRRRMFYFAQNKTDFSVLQKDFSISSKFFHFFTKKACVLLPFMLYFKYHTN